MAPCLIDNNYFVHVTKRQAQLFLEQCDHNTSLRYSSLGGFYNDPKKKLFLIKGPR